MSVLEIAKQSPNKAVIALLEELLVDAKEGRLLGLAGVTLNTEGDFAEVFSNNMLAEHCILTIAYLRILQIRVERSVEMD